MDRCEGVHFFFVLCVAFEDFFVIFYKKKRLGVGMLGVLLGLLTKAAPLPTVFFHFFQKAKRRKNKVCKMSLSSTCLVTFFKKGAKCRQIVSCKKKKKREVYVFRLKMKFPSPPLPTALV